MTTRDAITTTTDDVLDLIDAALAPAEYPGAYDPTDEERAAALEAWRIDGERTALWAANKLRVIEARRAEAKATADALRAAAAAHEDGVVASSAHDVAYFTGKLRQYHEEQIAGTRKKQTALPGAKLKTNPPSVSIVINDDDTLTEWAEEHHPEAIEYVEPKVMKSKLAPFGGKVDKDQPGDYPLVDPDSGEVLPGVVARVAPATFTVKLTDLVPEDTDPAI